MTTNKTKADAAEAEAASFLAKKGYKIIKRNFRFGRTGEIDIVAEHQGTLVFVEVKYRVGDAFGKPEDSVDVRKQSQIKRIASMYYYVNNVQDKACRFDVVAIVWHRDGTEIRHHESAFY